MSRKTCCLLVSMLLCGCPSGPKETKMVRDFFHTSSDDQEREFARYTLEQQWELYRFGMEVVHPPAMYLADSFAQRGEEVVPFLFRKLNEAKDTFDVYEIMLVFEALASLKRYDFSVHPEAMAHIEARVKSLPDGLWKEPVLELVSEIKSQAETESDDAP